MEREKSAIDLLTSASGFAFENKIALTDPKLPAAYFEAERDRLQVALGDLELLRGKQTENLFAAIVTSIGQVRMLKPEDCGPFVGSDKMTAPDFRVALESGQSRLVEVKHVYCADAMKQRKVFTKDYAQKLLAYADATNTPLRLAIYWSKWTMWTVVDPRKFLTPHGGLKIDMMEAAKQNEFNDFGDISIGIVAPLRLRMEVNPDLPNGVTPDGQAFGTIATADLYSGDVLVSDQIGKDLVFRLMLFSGWTLEGPSAVMDGERVAAIEFTSAPEDLPEDEDKMRIVSSLSRLFSNYFLSETRKEGAITQLTVLPQPDWFKHLRTWHRSAGQKSDLRLWLFHLRPSSEDSEGAAA